MIKRKDYLNALELIDQYHQKLNLSDVSNSFICVNKMHYPNITEGRKYKRGKSDYETKKGLTLIENDKYVNAAYPDRCFEQINDF